MVKDFYRCSIRHKAVCKTSRISFKVEIGLKRWEGLSIED